MAHRPIFQIVFTGARIITRATAEAWKQASAAQRAGASNAPSGLSNSSGLTLDEACQILNVAPPKGGTTDMEVVMARFKKLFDTNDPTKGGSFYLQSKILRARERIEAEVRNGEEKAELKKEAEEGWKPKVYKNR
jgi:import inner membrane translocase subunit TIM16